MMNFRKIAAASKGRLLLRYFTETTPEPIHPPGVSADGRQLETGGRLVSYYTGRDSRATWRPDMPAIFAKAIGIDPRYMPRDAEMIRLFEAKRADTGEAWPGQQRKLSGFDLVFSPHKSVSLAAEFAPTPAESSAYWNAVDRAADLTMRYVVHVLGWARKGHGGEDGADPGAVGWISFRHSTARPTLAVQDGEAGQTYVFDAPVAGDPHVHIHNFLMNLVVTADGRAGSLDSRRLTDARVKEFGAYFQAVLAQELRALGVRVAYDATEQAVVIPAIPDHVVQAFSKRDRQILHKAKRFAEGQGLNWDELSADSKLGIIEEASAEGRLGKIKADEKRLWREQAEDLGWKHTTVMEDVAYPTLSKTTRHERAYEYAARHLEVEFHTAAVIDHEKLGMYAARGLIGTGLEGPDDIAKVVELLEKRGIRIRGEHVALVVGISDQKVRVTNTAQIRIEESLAVLAHHSAQDHSGSLSVAAIRNAMRQSGVAFSREQQAAIHALGGGGALTLLTGVAGAGKTTLLGPLVNAWRSDRRFSEHGREVVGAAMAWRQADALQEAGIGRTYAISTLLADIESGAFQSTGNTVLVLDEASQIGPRPLLKLLEVQVRTGMTIKMLGDREQAQSIESGDSIEILRRALPPKALPELLTTIRQATKRAREIAALFREGDATTALAMKRADGHATLAGGDRDQVVAQIADLYIARRDILLASGLRRGITVSAPTNDDVAEISEAIRARLKARGEIAQDETVHRAVDQRGREYGLALAVGDRVRLFRRTWGKVSGKEQQVGNNGDVVEILGTSAEGLRIRTKAGDAADVEWRRLAADQAGGPTSRAGQGVAGRPGEAATGRLLLGFGHALTIDAAQGITSDEHIDALPRGTAGVTGFTSYVAESRSRGTTWTVIAEGALYEAERHSRALGDITPITTEHLWDRAAKDMSEKPYKALGIDLLNSARQDRERAIDIFIKLNRGLEEAQLTDPWFGVKAFQRLRAAAVNEQLGRYLPALDAAIAENKQVLGETMKAREVAAHLRALRTEAARTKQQLDAIASASSGPSPG
jgi:hypothetical protein